VYQTFFLNNIVTTSTHFNINFVNLLIPTIFSPNNSNLVAQRIFYNVKDSQQTQYHHNRKNKRLMHSWMHLENSNRADSSQPINH